MRQNWLLFAMLAVPVTQFVDTLPIPPRFIVKSQSELTIHLDEHLAQMHAELPITRIWGYEGTSPGPTIEVESGHALRVNWVNDLPMTHVFGVPDGACMAMRGKRMADVRATTHLHGAVVDIPSFGDRFHNNDGWPDDWTVPGETQIAEYPNAQSARTLWYHDHAMCETGRNVAAGLVGMYLIRDDYERSLNLPQWPYEIPLIIQSKGIGDDGHPTYVDDIANEFFGNATSVNGKLWPYLSVEPRRYRFRIVNASNARAFEMNLLDADDGSAGPPFIQIGTDAGFLAKPFVFDDGGDSSLQRLQVAPAERADVIVDFAGMEGRSFIVHNRSRQPGHAEVYLPEVMLIRVDQKLSGKDTSSVPTAMKPIEPLHEASSVVTRRITFDQFFMPDGSQMVMLNGKKWQDAITEFPKQGSTEIWELLNPLDDLHPFHMHLEQFQVLDRVSFDPLEYRRSGAVVPISDPEPPHPSEQGWKDVVRVPPDMLTRIIVRFDTKPGYSIYHCHILEHEDMDMMRPFQIVN